MISQTVELAVILLISMTPRPKCFAISGGILSILSLSDSAKLGPEPTMIFNPLGFAEESSTESEGSVFVERGFSSEVLVEVEELFFPSCHASIND